MQRNLYLPYDPAISLLSLYLREMKMYVRKKHLNNNVTAALFMMAKPRQPKHPKAYE